MKFKREETEYHTKKLLNICKKVLDEIGEYVEACFLVGSLVWGANHSVNKGSDIDLMVVFRKNRLRELLNGTFLGDELKLDLCEEVLDKKLADYFVSKSVHNHTLVSMDLIPVPFFKKMCEIPLTDQKDTFLSFKFGNLPQENSYTILDFEGNGKKIRKKNYWFRGGWRIELPLFFILNGKYFYGIPTVKLLTSRVLKGGDFYQTKVQGLFSEVCKRMLKEGDSKKLSVTNLFIHKNKFNPKYYKTFLEEESKTLDKIKNEGLE